MTIEQKALALVNEEPGFNCCHLGEVSSQLAIKTLCRAIEQHEAFRQEVSDAVSKVIKWGDPAIIQQELPRFIIAKPDPLVEAYIEATGWSKELAPHRMATLRAAIEKRGGKITWGEG